MIFDDGIEDDQELSHAGSEYDSEGLTRCLQALGELTNDRIEATSRKGGHVKHAADGSPASPDRTTTMEFPTITAERCQADQGGNLLAIESSQLGQLGQERGGRHRANARHTLHESGLALQLFVRLYQTGNFFLDLADLFLQLLDHAAHAFDHALRTSRLQAIRLGGAQLDQLSSTNHQFLKFLLDFRDFLHRSRLDMLSKAGDHFAIDPIGLGQDPQAPSEVANLTWIDHGALLAGSGQLGNELAWVSSGCFDHHQATAGHRQFIEKSPETGAVIGGREASALDKQKHLERILSNVNPDKRIKNCVHELVPVLRMRARLEVGSGGCSGWVHKNRRRSCSA